MTGQSTSETSNGAASDAIAFVRAEIRRWREQGLIPRTLAERLLAEYEAHPKRESRRAVAPEDEWPRVEISLTPQMVLLYLGGILILSAATILLSRVWSDLGDGGRFMLVLLPTMALYGIGAQVYRSQPAQRMAANVLLFFGCLLVPLTLWLGITAATGSSPSPEVTRLQALTVSGASLVIHLLTLVAFRSPLLTIPYPLSFLWSTISSMDMVVHGSSGSDKGQAAALLVAGLLLLAVGFTCDEKQKPGYAVVPNLVGAFTALGALAFLGADGHQPGWEIAALLGSLGAIGASVYRKNGTYLFVGALFLMINIFSIGFEYFANTVGLPLTLLVCGGLSIALGYGVQRVRSEYLG
jgi:hypothetical protein